MSYVQSHFTAHRPQTTALHVLRTVLLLVLLLNCSRLHAQDIHFSQIDINPVALNPAYNGFFDGTGRFALAYRTQWSSVSTPYQTALASGEFSLHRNPYHRSGFNLGFMLYRDQAGTLNYGTTAGNLIISYYHSLNGRNNNYLSFAVEAGYCQAGFNTDEIEFYDPNENIDQTKTNYPVVGAGIAWFYQPNTNLYAKVGLSARNLNRPNISYLSLDQTRLQPHFTLYTRFEYRYNQSISILPVAAIQYQQPNSEFLYGADLKYYIDESVQRTLSLSAGILYRNRDALVLNFSVDYNAFIFSINYDANLSKLTPASHTFGAIELALVYRLSKTSTRHKSLPCPVM